METPNERFKTIKSLLLLAGAFTLAFLLGEMVHKFGHYLGHMPMAIRESEFTWIP